jgi:hypothetical protein
VGDQLCKDYFYIYIQSTEMGRCQEWT